MNRVVRAILIDIYLQFLEELQHGFEIPGAKRAADLQSMQFAVGNDQSRIGIPFDFPDDFVERLIVENQQTLPPSEIAIDCLHRYFGNAANTLTVFDTLSFTYPRRRRFAATDARRITFGFVMQRGLRHLYDTFHHCDPHDVVVQMRRETGAQRPYRSGARLDDERPTRIVINIETGLAAQQLDPAAAISPDAECARAAFPQ